MTKVKLIQSKEVPCELNQQWLTNFHFLGHKMYQLILSIGKAKSGSIPGSGS